MEITAIKDWLNSAVKDYETGVQLYVKFGDNESYKSLFCKGKTAFTEKILREKLADLKQEDQVQRVIVNTKDVSTDEWESWPEEMRKLKEDASRLYAEAATMQRTLAHWYETKTVTDGDGQVHWKLTADHQKAGIIANEILGKRDEWELVTAKLDEWRRTKKLPAAKVSKFDFSAIDSAFEIQRKINAARVFISKQKNKRLRAADVAERILERDALERRLTELV